MKKKGETASESEGGGVIRYNNMLIATGQADLGDYFVSNKDIVQEKKEYSLSFGSKKHHASIRPYPEREEGF